MTKLSQQQIAALTGAATHPDGFAVRPNGMKPASAAKVAAKLIEFGLARMLHSRGDAPVWHQDESGKRFSLKILKAGRAMVAASAAQDASGELPGTSDHEALTTSQVRTSHASRALTPTNVTKKRPTKRSRILELMGRAGGATLDDLTTATGWLPHTTRAALTGLRKSGFAVERSRDDERNISVYKVAPMLTADAA